MIVSIEDGAICSGLSSLYVIQLFGVDQWGGSYLYAYICISGERWGMEGVLTIFLCLVTLFSQEVIIDVLLSTGRPSMESTRSI